MVNHILEKFSLDEKIRYSMLEGEALDVAIEAEKNIDQLEFELEKLDIELESALDDHYDMECDLGEVNKLYNKLSYGIESILKNKKMKKADILEELNYLMEVVNERS